MAALLLFNTQMFPLVMILADLQSDAAPLGLTTTACRVNLFSTAFVVPFVTFLTSHFRQ